MRFSIVTPSRNQAEFLPDTLASVRIAASLLAPADEAEHIVRDGASTDATRRILASQSFARWTSEPDHGQADAINRGFAEATGDIFAYLCSDDLLEPAALRLVSEIFNRHPEADVVYGDYNFLEADSGWKRRKLAGPWSLDRLHRQNFLSQPATFWRRRVHERLGGFDTSLQYCLDHEYWLRIAPRTRWEYLPAPLATMRLHGGAKTASRIAEMWRESAGMVPRHAPGHHARRDALRMQVYGQHFYRLKRAFFRTLGHWLLDDPTR